MNTYKFEKDSKPLCFLSEKGFNVPAPRTRVCFLHAHVLTLCARVFNSRICYKRFNA
jgi:hypothetical protein